MDEKKDFSFFIFEINTKNIFLNTWMWLNFKDDSYEWVKGYKRKAEYLYKQEEIEAHSLTMQYSAVLKYPELYQFFLFTNK